MILLYTDTLFDTITFQGLGVVDTIDSRANHANATNIRGLTCEYLKSTDSIVKLEHVET